MTEIRKLISLSLSSPIGFFIFSPLPCRGRAWMGGWVPVSQPRATHPRFVPERRGCCSLSSASPLCGVRQPEHPSGQELTLPIECTEYCFKYFFFYCTTRVFCVSFGASVLFPSWKGVKRIVYFVSQILLWNCFLHFKSCIPVKNVTWGVWGFLLYVFICD